jgi:transcriptional regulator with XRE-family HTH domain
MTPAQLTAWRQDRGWSGAEAARQLGCARNSMAAWEAGRAEIPRYIELACVALANNWQLAPQASRTESESFRTEAESFRIESERFRTESD